MVRMPASRRPRFAIVLLALASACADRERAADDAAEPRTGGTVVVAVNSDVEAMNSLVASDRNAQEVIRFVMFLPLVRYDENLGYEPALAERWEMLGDTGIVFHLRRDVRWHDGMPTTARDVLFTYERAQDPATTFPNAEYFTNWRAAHAIDSFTVRFSFTPHVEPLAGLPFLPIMPAHLLDSIPAARMRQAAFNKAPVGNGPFRFVEYRANDRWIFAANPDFPAALGGRPYLDRLVWRVIPDAAAALTELTAGTTDIVLYPQASDFPRVSKQPGFRGIERPGRQYASIIWNGRIAPFNDPTVRQALTMALDRQQMIDVLRHGYGVLAVGPIAPYHWAFDADIAPLPFDPDSARALLRGAGIEDRNGDGKVELPNGRPFTIELKIPANSILSRGVAELATANFAAIGVTVTTRPLDFATLLQDITTTKRNFQAAALGWESDFRVNLRDLYHSESLNGPYQIASYSNPRVDALIDSLAIVQDRTRAKQMYSEVQRILRAEQPWSYLYYYPDVVLARDRVQGTDMDLRGFFVNVQKWWVTNPPTAVGSPQNDSAARAPARDSAPAR